MGAAADSLFIVLILDLVVILHLYEAVKPEVPQVKCCNFLFAELLLRTEGRFELLAEDFIARLRLLRTYFPPP